MKIRRSIVFGLVCAWFSFGSPTTGLAQVAVRDLSDFESTSQPFVVAIVVTPPPGTIAFGVEDAPPDGWIDVTNIDNSGTWDAVNNKVKWGPYFNDDPVTLHYQVAPPGGSSGSTPCFSGVVSIDGNNLSISGASCLPAPVPALSEWGLCATTLLLLTAGTLVLRRRQAPGGCRIPTP